MTTRVRGTRFELKISPFITPGRLSENILTLLAYSGTLPGFTKSTRIRLFERDIFHSFRLDNYYGRTNLKSGTITVGRTFGKK